MIIANGTINGKEYLDAPVPLNVLKDFIIKQNPGFSFPEAGNGKPITFRVLPNSNIMRVDRRNLGRKAVTPAWYMAPDFTINTNEGSISLRYADTRIPGTNGARYTPKKVLLVKGREFFTIRDNNLDLTVWTILNPKCKTSPYARLPKYEHYDEAKESRKGMDNLLKMSAVQNEILTMAESDLRRRAAAVSYTNGAGNRVVFSTATKVEVDILRVALIRRLNADGDRFISAWALSESSLEGLVKVAQSLGILEYSKMKAGGGQWRYAPNYGGESIVNVREKADPIKAIITELTVNASHKVPSIEKLVKMVSAPAPEKVVDEEIIPANDAKIAQTPDAYEPEVDSEESFEYVEEDKIREVVERAFALNILELDIEKGQIYILNSKGNKWRPLFAPEIPESWRDEVVPFLIMDPEKFKLLEATTANRE